MGKSEKPEKSRKKAVKKTKAAKEPNAKKDKNYLFECFSYIYFDIALFVNNVYLFGVYHLFNLYIEINHFANLGEIGNIV